METRYCRIVSLNRVNFNLFTWLAPNHYVNNCWFIIDSILRNEFLLTLHIHFHSGKCISKCRLQNDVRFVQALMHQLPRRNATSADFDAFHSVSNPDTFTLISRIRQFQSNGICIKPPTFQDIYLELNNYFNGICTENLQWYINHISPTLYSSFIRYFKIFFILRLPL